MKSLTPVTETFYVLVTDNTARLVFYSKETAEDYVKDHNIYDNTSIQKVYGQTVFREVDDDE